jgi:hypothetical protein
MSRIAYHTTTAMRLLDILEAGVVTATDGKAFGTDGVFVCTDRGCAEQWASYFATAPMASNRGTTYEQVILEVEVPDSVTLRDDVNINDHDHVDAGIEPGCGQFAAVDSLPVRGVVAATEDAVRYLDETYEDTLGVEQANELFISPVVDF